MQNAPMEHTAVLLTNLSLTCIKLSHGFKTFVLSIFVLPLKTRYTVPPIGTNNP